MASSILETVSFEYILPANYQLSSPICGICHVEVPVTEVALTHPMMGVLFHRPCLNRHIQTQVENLLSPTCPVCQKPLQIEGEIGLEDFLPPSPIKDEIEAAARSPEAPPRIALLLRTRSTWDRAQIYFALRAAILSGVEANVESVIEYNQERNVGLDLNSAWKFALLSSQFSVAAKLEKIIDEKLDHSDEDSHVS
jgi:hypothetical protein